MIPLGVPTFRTQREKNGALGISSSRGRLVSTDLFTMYKFDFWLTTDDGPMNTLCERVWRKRAISNANNKNLHQMLFGVSRGHV